MALDYGREVTLTLTVDEHRLRAESRSSDEGYGSSSPISAVSTPMTTLPLTIPEKSPSLSPLEGKRFRVPWGRSSNGDEELRRLEKEKEAEDYISSLSGRSLTIQYAALDKVLNKEKRRIKFGLSSKGIMDLAIRRYSYKYFLANKVSDI
jgi:hypothetical protein